MSGSQEDAPSAASRLFLRGGSLRTQRALAPSAGAGLPPRPEVDVDIKRRPAAAAAVQPAQPPCAGRRCPSFAFIAARTRPLAGRLSTNQLRPGSPRRCSSRESDCPVGRRREDQQANAKVAGGDSCRSASRARTCRARTRRSRSRTRDVRATRCLVVAIYPERRPRTKSATRIGTPAMTQVWEESGQANSTTPHHRGQPAERERTRTRHIYTPSPECGSSASIAIDVAQLLAAEDERTPARVGPVRAVARSRREVHVAARQSAVQSVLSCSASRSGHVANFQPRLVPSKLRTCPSTARLAPSAPNNLARHRRQSSNRWEPPDRPAGSSRSASPPSRAGNSSPEPVASRLTPRAILARRVARFIHKAPIPAPRPARPPSESDRRPTRRRSRARR